MGITFWVGGLRHIFLPLTPFPLLPWRFTPFFIVKITAETQKTFRKPERGPRQLVNAGLEPDTCDIRTSPHQPVRLPFVGMPFLEF
jgi:hypothetical protein